MGHGFEKVVPEATMLAICAIVRIVGNFPSFLAKHVRPVTLDGVDCVTKLRINLADSLKW